MPDYRRSVTLLLFTLFLYIHTVHVYTFHKNKKKQKLKKHGYLCLSVANITLNRPGQHQLLPIVKWHFFGVTKTLVGCFTTRPVSLYLFIFILSTLKVPTESYLSQLSWQHSPLYTESTQTGRQFPPPCPAPGQQPLQVRDLWEQYSDQTTGRFFYVNAITKERSWKPPRRSRGSTVNKVQE